MTNGKVEIGDVLRDDRGEYYEVIGVQRPEAVFSSPHLTGSHTEKCVGLGEISSREIERRAKGRSFAHKGPRLKETA